MRVELATAGDTEALGRRLAAALAGRKPRPAVLMEGPLGAGKTTLVRALVAALPGGGEARVSSPSFTVCNLYPTSPETAHLDLYRLDGMPLDEDLLDLVLEGRALALVEWAEHLAEADRPGDALVLRWLPAESGRLVELTATGPAARTVLEALRTGPAAAGRAPK